MLAVIAFNLTRAAATLTGDELAKATTGTIRRKLINTAARLASTARRITRYLPSGCPWQHCWTALLNQVCGPPATTTPRPPSQTPAQPDNHKSDTPAARRDDPT